MTRTQELVAAHVYENEEAVIQDALRRLLRSRPDARIKLAVYRYRTEQVSLARAAALAGVSWAEMREILLEEGVLLRLGPETVAEARHEVQVLVDYMKADV